jgi:hypothetical protein
MKDNRHSLVVLCYLCSLLPAVGAVARFQPRGTVINRKPALKLILPLLQMIRIAKTLSLRHCGTACRWECRFYQLQPVRW